MPPPVTFALNKHVETTTPIVEGVIDQVKPGMEYTFQLVVVDDAGHESQPVTVVVDVRDLPVAKIATPKPAVAGKPITLDASGSGPQGQIKTYRWTLVKETPLKK
jgi:hypothetical protein